MARRAGRSGVNLSGEKQRFISLIIRGLYEYQTFIRVSEAASDDYDLLIRRMLDTVGLNEPARLTEAWPILMPNPTTGTPASWHRIPPTGHPILAMGEWSRILTDAPEAPGLWQDG